MKSITYQKRVNEGWNNYPAQVDVKVDDKLFQILSIIQESKFRSENKPNDNCICFRKIGVMTQDSGFGWIELSSKTYGQGMGMFYGGVAKGTEYLDLNMLNNEGEYKYADLLKVA